MVSDNGKSVDSFLVFLKGDAENIACFMNPADDNVFKGMNTTVVSSCIPSVRDIWEDLWKGGR